MAATQFRTVATKPVLALVVEDDLDLGEVVEDIMTDLFGMEVVRAYNAEQALHLIQMRSDYGLVFSDIKMPGPMNGVELASRIRANYPTLPILLTTGFAPSTCLPDVERFPLLRKPYQTKDLKAALASIGVVV